MDAPDSLEDRETPLTLACSGCERQLFNEEQPVKKTPCCDGLLCEGCCALLLPLTPKGAITKSCPSCTLSRTWTGTSLQSVYFTRFVTEPEVVRCDQKRKDMSSRNPVYQACADEVAFLRSLHESRGRRLEEMKERFKLNEEIARENAVRLDELKELTAKYEGMKEDLDSKLRTVLESNEKRKEALEALYDRIVQLDSEIFAPGSRSSSSVTESGLA
ncbi:hypothetical protein EST38_g13489 [Candolleomyces aberdarensis]|uniref:Uncharacterized protein n=1 Tax=Candolleomyces aberdarensis TaxID=2316362 RepID=A0A4Q2D1N8_9AGAR|nr:hypothetical protein EST38_g13489 [Candolleomyces aberdarensis]